MAREVSVSVRCAADPLRAALFAVADVFAAAFGAALFGAEDRAVEGRAFAEDAFDEEEAADFAGAFWLRAGLVVRAAAFCDLPAVFREEPEAFAEPCRDAALLRDEFPVPAERPAVDFLAAAFFAPRDELAIRPFFELFAAVLLEAPRFEDLAAARDFTLRFVPRFAAGFDFEEDFFAEDFFAEDFFPEDFFAEGFFAEDFFAEDFFAEDFLADDFFPEERFAELFFVEPFLLRVAILSPFFRPVIESEDLIASGRALKFGPSDDNGKRSSP